MILKSDQTVNQKHMINIFMALKATSKIWTNNKIGHPSFLFYHVEEFGEYKLHDAQHAVSQSLKPKGSSFEHICTQWMSAIAER